MSIVTAIVKVAAAVLICFVIGLQYFVHEVRMTYSENAPLDRLPKEHTGIVVATGGGGRILTGLELLADERASRMLISGVGQGVSKTDIRNTLTSDANALTEFNHLMDCCIDLDAKAANTRGNAQQAAAWASRHAFSHILLVTADYHMPRSLILFRRQMPERVIITHAVSSLDSVQGGETRPAWWRRPLTVMALSREYGKYLLSLVI